MQDVKSLSRAVLVLTSEILTVTLAGGLILIFFPTTWMHSLGLS